MHQCSSASRWLCVCIVRSLPGRYGERGKRQKLSIQQKLGGNVLFTNIVHVKTALYEKKDQEAKIPFLTQEFTKAVGNKKSYKKSGKEESSAKQSKPNLQKNRNLSQPKTERLRNSG